MIDRRDIAGPDKLLYTVSGHRPALDRCSLQTACLGKYDRTALSIAAREGGGREEDQHLEDKAPPNQSSRMGENINVAFLGKGERIRSGSRSLRSNFIHEF